MITSTTLVLVNEHSSERQTYINPTQIICIRPMKTSAEDMWRIVFCNDLNIIVDSKNLKNIIDHCEVLIKKM